MKVKSYWMDVENFSMQPKVGMPVLQITLAGGQPIGTITKVEDGRALVKLTTAREWETVESWGVGFSQFEDTED